MGILRTDKISGLETPTAVTGSVYFDGTGDYLATEVSNDFALGTNDFTFEMWVYYDNKNNGDTPAVLDSTTTTYAPLIGYIENDASTNGHAVVYISANGSSWGIASNKTFGFINEKQWYHLAISRSGSNFYLFKDGQLTDSFTSSSAIHQGANQIGFGRIQTNTYFDGYVSNARLVKGTALYTSNFTPPVHELEVIGDTVLLCCNNPDSAGAEGTGKTITVNGDAAASTVSPGLTRDFTGGTEFQGVTVFDTQGYFVPPSGTTEQRGAGRGIFSGGYTPTNFLNTIEYIQISTQGNSKSFGDLISPVQIGEGGKASNHIRGLTGGGSGSPGLNQIEYITIATTGNGVDFGDLTENRRSLGGAGSNTRAVFCGGTTGSMTDRIDYVTAASLGDAADFGNLLVARRNVASNASPTRGVFAGGNPGPSPYLDDTIDYITMATTGNAADFGNLATAMREQAGGGNTTRGLIAGGYTAPAGLNTISYITVASLGNTQDFGDMTVGGSGRGGTSNTVNCVFGGGSIPAYTNTMDFVKIASTGNASDFGDLNYAPFLYSGQQNSDSHGGLS